MCVEMHVCVECVCGMVCCVWCVCMTYGLRVRRVVSVRVACVRMVGGVCYGVCWCVWRGLCVWWVYCGVCVLVCACHAYGGYGVRRVCACVRAYTCKRQCPEGQCND